MAGVGLSQIWDERDRRYALSRRSIDDETTQAVRLWRLREAQEAEDVVLSNVARSWVKPRFIHQPKS